MTADFPKFIKAYKDLCYLSFSSRKKKMFWKIALGLGIFGLVLSVVLIIVAVRAFYSAGFQSNTEDIAFAGLVLSGILLVVSFLIAAVSLIFVLRSSKKEWDAKNIK